MNLTSCFAKPLKPFVHDARQVQKSVINIASSTPARRKEAAITATEEYQSLRLASDTPIFS